MEVCGDKEDAGPGKAAPQKNGPCHKCGTARSFTSSRTRLFCRACYAEAVLHQFKKTLQVVKPARQQAGQLAPILVAFSGGPASSALLACFEQVLRQDARKVQFAVHGVWVDCLDVLPLSPAEAAAIRARMAERMAACPFRSFRRVPLCAAFAPATLEPDERGPSMQQLQRVFAGSRRPEVTWKEDLLDVLVRALLLRCAQLTGGGCARLATGETMTRCCIRLLAGMARGIGANAALTVAGVDPVTFGHLNVVLVRPLVGLTAREVALYLRAVGSAPLPTIPTFSTMACDKRSSLSLLSESFLLTLQNAHDHTLPTLIKSAQKIEPPAAGLMYSREWGNCMGCDAELRKTIAAQQSEPAKSARCAVCLLVPPREAHRSDGCCGDGGGSGCDCSGGETAPPLCRVCALLVEEMQLANGATARDVVVSVQDQMRARIAACSSTRFTGARTASGRPMISCAV